MGENSEREKVLGTEGARERREKERGTEGERKMGENRTQRGMQM